jgi:hypothetical protein
MSVVCGGERGDGAASTQSCVAIMLNDTHAAVLDVSTQALQLWHGVHQHGQAWHTSADLHMHAVYKNADCPLHCLLPVFDGVCTSSLEGSTTGMCAPPMHRAACSRLMTGR